jgi:hypothetical protein
MERSTIRQVSLLGKPAVTADTTTMALGSPHRKQVTHFNEPGHYHELTFGNRGHCMVIQVLMENLPARRKKLQFRACRL